jgi:hypothetical protein
MEIPNLAGVITKKDIEKKGGKSFSADYIPWAKISNILLEKAPGWQFKIEFNPDNGPIWKMPNNTGSIFCYFEKDGFKTSLFPYAIMNKSHRAILFNEITSRDYADNHRRALCACACYVFGLAYELWARLEVQDNDESERCPKGQHYFTKSTELIGSIIRPETKAKDFSFLSEKFTASPLNGSGLCLSRLQHYAWRDLKKISEILESFSTMEKEEFFNEKKN